LSTVAAPTQDGNLFNVAGLGLIFPSGGVGTTRLGHNGKLTGCYSQCVIDPTTYRRFAICSSERAAKDAMTLILALDAAFG